MLHVLEVGISCVPKCHTDQLIGIACTHHCTLQCPAIKSLMPYMYMLVATCITIILQLPAEEWLHIVFTKDVVSVDSTSLARS